MLGKPKFKLGDQVQFMLNDEGLIHGKVYIIDAYGTFEDDSDVSYDVIVENYGPKKEECLFKHINEKIISSYENIL